MPSFVPYIQSDEGGTLIGGGVGAIGGGYAIYEWMRNDKLNNAWDTIISAWNELRALAYDYAEEVNALITIWDNAYINGISPDENAVSIEMENIENKELRMITLIKVITTATETPIPGEGLLAMLWGWSEGLFSIVNPQFYIVKYALIGLAAYRFYKWAGIGAGIHKIWEKIRNNHNDTNNPSGTSVTCPSCAQTVWAPDTETVGIELQRHLNLAHTVNTAVALAAVPSLVYNLSQLPKWVQNDLAIKFGMNPQQILSESAWRNNIQVDYRTVAAVVGGIAIAILATYAVAVYLPTLGAAGSSLARALVLT